MLARTLLLAWLCSIGTLAVWYFFGWLAALLVWIGVGLIYSGAIMTMAMSKTPRRKRT